MRKWFYSKKQFKDKSSYIERGFKTFLIFSLVSFFGVFCLQLGLCLCVCYVKEAKEKKS